MGDKLKDETLATRRKDMQPRGHWRWGENSQGENIQGRFVVKLGKISTL